MGKRQELEGALAKAESDLARAVTDCAEAHANVAEAGANLERARAACRLARAALTEFIRAEPLARTVKPAGASTEAPPQHAVEAPSGKRPRKSVRRFLARLLAGKPGAANAAARRMLARQSFMLLALVVSYLQYYFFDVNLQVARLPSITVTVFG
jgi:multidrug resistance efflux pump